LLKRFAYDNQLASMPTVVVELVGRDNWLKKRSPTAGTALR
jgi:hypothetical protein